MAADDDAPSYLSKLIPIKVSFIGDTERDLKKKPSEITPLSPSLSTTDYKKN